MLQRLHLKELFEKPAESIKSTLYNYCDAYILVTRDVKVNAGDNEDFAFKTCAQFSIWNTKIFLLMKQRRS